MKGPPGPWTDAQVQELLRRAEAKVAKKKAKTEKLQRKAHERFERKAARVRAARAAARRIPRT